MTDGCGAGRGAPARMRADKWLWHARFFRSRSLAARMLKAGQLRINTEPVRKSARQLVAGDVLTFPQGRRIRVIRVVALSERRGPPDEAATLYIDLTPPPPPSGETAGAEETDTAAPRPPGRPGRNQRRSLIRFKTRPGEAGGLE